MRPHLWSIVIFVGCAGAPGAESSHAAPASRGVLADPSGCRLERVTAAGPDEAHFQFHGPSRDGRLIVGWARGEERGAYLLELGTGARRDLPGLVNAGTISSDGRRALVASGPDRTPDIVEYDLTTGEIRAVAPHPQADFLATYVNGGRDVLFNSYRSGASDVYMVPLSGGAPRRLTDFDGYDAHADLSPDGRTILFHRRVAEGDYDIYRLDVSTLRAEPFLAGPGEQSYPAWSPDGRAVAYASDEGHAAGATDILLASVDGTRLARLTASPGYNTYPAWAPDGRSLFINSERDGRRDVFRITLDDDLGCGGQVR